MLHAHLDTPPFPYTTLFRSRPRRCPPGPGSLRARATRLPPRPPPLRLSRSAARPWLPSPQRPAEVRDAQVRSEEHTSELQSLTNLDCSLLLEKKKGQSKIQT